VRHQGFTCINLARISSSRTSGPYQKAGALSGLGYQGGRLTPVLDQGSRRGTGAVTPIGSSASVLSRRSARCSAGDG